DWVQILEPRTEIRLAITVQVCGGDRARKIAREVRARGAQPGSGARGDREVGEREACRGAGGEGGDDEDGSGVNSEAARPTDGRTQRNIGRHGSPDREE